MAKDKNLGLQLIVVKPNNLTSCYYYLNATDDRHVMDKDDLYEFIAKFISQPDLEIVHDCLMTFQPFAVDVVAKKAVKLQPNWEEEKQQLRLKAIFPSTKEVEKEIRKEVKEKTVIGLGTDWIKMKIPSIESLLSKVLKNREKNSDTKKKREFK